MQRYLLGIDNGLTSTKAAVYDLKGGLKGTCSQPTQIVSGRSGTSEIDMREQWATTRSVIRRVVEETVGSPAEIAAIGLSGHGNGLYLLDKAGGPLRRAFTSMDHRAMSTVQAIEPQAKEELERLSLQDIWDAQPGMLLRWLKANEPAVYERTGTVLFCKDWIRYCLTGQVHTDYTDVSASGLFNNSRRSYDRAILELLGIPEVEDALPEAIPSGQVAGQLTPNAAEACGLLPGVPVVGGLFDVDANPLGAGLVREGRFCVIAGTWNINVALSRSPITPKHIRQCIIYGDESFYACVDSSATSASNLEWFLQHVLDGRCSYAGFEDVIGRYSPQDTDLLFMPFVHSGLRNDNPGATFCGLRSAHGKDDMLRAVAEGIAFAHRYHIDNLIQEGLAGDSVLLTGGASRNKAWCQVFADILQRSTTVPDSRETGALGACIAAGIGIGAFSSVEQAVDAMVRTKETYQPDPTAAGAYGEKYERFLEMLDWMSR